MKTATDKRVYLDNMGEGGFGAILSSPAFEFDYEVEYEDGTRKQDTAWSWVKPEDDTPFTLCMHEPGVLTASLLGWRPCRVWYEQFKPGIQGQPQYVEVRRRGATVVAKDGPGNCRDRGVDFDLDALAAEHGVEIVR